jgi:hypothetical protein
MGWRADARGFGVLLVMTAASLVACGGHVQGGGSENDPSSPQTAGSKGSQPGFDPTTDAQLGNCKMGPPETFDENGKCAWVADGRCYQDRAMACNCVCPRSKDSVCLSGFDGGPNGHVSVSCD